MGYLEDFQAQINNRDFSKFMQLWEEYCTSDRVESAEFIELLRSIKFSDFSNGKFLFCLFAIFQLEEELAGGGGGLNKSIQNN